MTLSSFGTPHVEFVNINPDTASIVDAFRPLDFDMVKCPYIFFRFNDSVRVLNMATKRYTTLAKVPLSPVPVKYPMGSSLFVHRKDDRNPNSNFQLFTMAEFIREDQSGQQSQSKRNQCTKLLKLHFD